MIARGRDAESLLETREFLEAWRDLRAACPWSTAFQSPEFAVTWYRAYAERYEPVLLFAREENGALAGLLALGSPKDTSDDWTVAGGHHAEYQTWLARKDSDFIEPALAQLFDTCPLDRLRFLYLPAAVPLQWTNGSWSRRVRIAPWHRPLMKVDDRDALDRSLAKKGNKSRLNRLKRSGPIDLERVTSPRRLAEVMDRFAELCDFRHGAAHRTLPFRADPIIADFYLGLLAHPDFLDVSLFWAGENLIAAHMGVRDGTYLYNGMLTHSPFEARHSPGKLHLMLLARRLADQGFEFFDLTPGNDPWKERFASTQEALSELVVHRDSGGRRSESFRLDMKRRLADLIRVLGLDPSELRQRVAAARHGGLSGVTNAVRARPPCLYHLGKPLTEIEGDSGGLEVNRLSHLVDHAAAEPRILNSDFLAQALERIERGQSFYSQARQGSLSFLVWAAPPGARSLDVPEGGPLIEVEILSSGSASHLGAVLRQTLAEAETSHAIVSIPQSHVTSGQALRQLGLVPGAPGQQNFKAAG